jgi:ABC-type iron transport system FetAB ATPase subunit
VLYSALLKLPREIVLRRRSLGKWSMNELWILGVKDSRICGSGRRISGEKRRVSITCELVTSPSILFLDELTSGECYSFVF